MATARGTIHLGDIPVRGLQSRPRASSRRRATATPSSARPPCKVEAEAGPRPFEVELDARLQPGLDHPVRASASSSARTSATASCSVSRRRVDDLSSSRSRRAERAPAKTKTALEADGGTPQLRTSTRAPHTTKSDTERARAEVDEAAGRRRHDRGAPAHLPLLAVVLPHLPHSRQGRLPQLDLRPDQAQVGLVRRPGPRRRGRHLRRRPVPLVVPRRPDHDGHDRSSTGRSRRRSSGAARRFPWWWEGLARSTRRSSATSASSCSSATSSSSRRRPIPTRPFLQELASSLQPRPALIDAPRRAQRSSTCRRRRSRCARLLPDVRPAVVPPRLALVGLERLRARRHLPRPPVLQGPRRGHPRRGAGAGAVEHPARTSTSRCFANDKACCLPICRDPECPDCMKLNVGRLQHPRRPHRGCLVRRAARTSAATSTCPVRTDDAAVRLASDARRHRHARSTTSGPQYSKDGRPVDGSCPRREFAGYSRRYWQGAAGFSPYIPFVPTPKAYGGGTVVVIPTRHHYEELNPGLPTFGGDVFWDDWDTLFYFATDATPVARRRPVRAALRRLPGRRERRARRRERVRDPDVRAPDLGDRVSADRQPGSTRTTRRSTTPAAASPATSASTSPRRTSAA